MVQTAGHIHAFISCMLASYWYHHDTKPRTTQCFGELLSLADRPLTHPCARNMNVNTIDLIWARLKKSSLFVTSNLVSSHESFSLHFFTFLLFQIWNSLCVLFKQKNITRIKLTGTCTCRIVYRNNLRRRSYSIFQWSQTSDRRLQRMQIHYLQDQWRKDQHCRRHCRRSRKGIWRLSWNSSWKRLQICCSWYWRWDFGRKRNKQIGIHILGSRYLQC